MSEAVKENAVALRLSAGSQEASFLSSFCPLGSTPTIILIRYACEESCYVRRNIDCYVSRGVVVEQLEGEGTSAVTATKLSDRLLPALIPSQDEDITAPSVPFSSPPTFVPAPATHATSSPPAPGPATPLDSVVERPTPSSTAPPARTRPSEPPLQTETSAGSPNQAQQTQRADYIKMQKDREQKQREERERIKQQIKSDREERRRREELRKQPLPADGAISVGSSSSTVPKSFNIRVQVRTFDGSTLRQTFSQNATITSDLRPWIDSSSSQTAPYNLKLILTPLPNRNIEAGEEEQTLTDLGIRGSCTLVMVPVKGYVESYTGSSAGGLVGSAVSGGYNIVSGTAGAVVGGLRTFLGWGQQPSPTTGINAGVPGSEIPEEAGQSAPKDVRVRTLADQRAEAKKDQQFYNGNQLNFEPRKDEGNDD